MTPLQTLTLGLIATLALPELALAGTGGTEFSPAYTLITGWMQGELGRLIAAGLLVTGVAMGIVRQSVVAAVPAIAAALVFAVGPTVIGAIITATI